MDRANSEKEQLDDLSLNGPSLYESLDSLAWINKWLGNYKYITEAILQTIAQSELREFKIIDLGCGGGDLLRHLAQVFDQKGIQYQLLGLDGNPNTIEYARNASKKNARINYQVHDLLSTSFALEPSDILISSHFIYHFSNSDLKEFLNKNLPNVKLAFINSGLENSGIAKFLFRYFSWILPISKSAQKDGLAALGRSFTKQELQEISSLVSNKTFTLRRVPFFRLLLHIRCL